MESNLPNAQAGDLIQLVGLRHKSFIFALTPGAVFQSHRGVLQHDDLIGARWGSQVFSHLGAPFFLLQPSLADLLLDLPRTTQILYPKDIGFILVTMGIVYPSVKFAVNALRAKGVKVGCVKVRVFRPFPGRALWEAVKGAKVVAAVDRNALAALYEEMQGAFYRCLDGGRGPLVMGRVMGIGGNAIPLLDIGHVMEECLEALKGGRVEKALDWYPIRGIDFDPARDIIAE